ncbi:MAG: 16S rRNA (guanine(527)-N(7))-methyltransferase RsmG [bacterium]|nr:16S rRNA (guanine(527)-N(7))-methyltransferase RsmG [bacterium]
MKQLQNLCNQQQWQLIIQYAKLLREINQQVNLISRKDINNLFENHIAPSFAYKILDRIHTNEYILDIGSGGGLPGIVNAILFPESDFLLVDSTKKKVTALDKIISELHLTNISALWSRVEEMNIPEYQNKFDRTTSRAVAPMQKIIEWSKPLLKDGGTIEALKGGDIEKEISESKQVITKYKLPSEYHYTERMKNLVLLSTTK